MDKIRPYVWIALAATLYLGYMLWQHDYPPSPETSVPVAQTARNSDTVPSLPGTPGATAAPQASSFQANAIPDKRVDAKSIRVRTDVLDLDISTEGGELDRADLLKYPISKEEP